MSQLGSIAPIMKENVPFSAASSQSTNQDFHQALSDAGISTKKQDSQITDNGAATKAPKATSATSAESAESATRQTGLNNKPGPSIDRDAAQDKIKRQDLSTEELISTEAQSKGTPRTLINLPRVPASGVHTITAKIAITAQNSPRSAKASPLHATQPLHGTANAGQPKPLQPKPLQPKSLQLVPSLPVAALPASSEPCLPPVEQGSYTYGSFQVPEAGSNQATPLLRNVETSSTTTISVALNPKIGSSSALNGKSYVDLKSATSRSFVSGLPFESSRSSATPDPSTEVVPQMSPEPSPTPVLASNTEVPALARHASTSSLVESPAECSTVETASSIANSSISFPLALNMPSDKMTESKKQAETPPIASDGDKAFDSLPAASSAMSNVAVPEAPSSTEKGRFAEVLKDKVAGSVKDSVSDQIAVSNASPASHSPAPSLVTTSVATISVPGTVNPAHTAATGGTVIEPAPKAAQSDLVQANPVEHLRTTLSLSPADLPISSPSSTGPVNPKSPVKTGSSATLAAEQKSKPTSDIHGSHAGESHSTAIASEQTSDSGNEAQVVVKGSGSQVSVDSAGDRTTSAPGATLNQQSSTPLQQMAQATPVQGSGQNDGAAADSAGSSQSASLPAGSIDNNSVSSQGLPAVNSAQLIQSMHQSEMRVGMHSVEFGNLSINTSLNTLPNHQSILAQISTDHAELGRALAMHLPAMQEKLGTAYGMLARVEIRDGASTTSYTNQDHSNQTHSNQDQQARGSRQGQPQPSSSSAIAGFDSTTAASKNLTPTSMHAETARLDIRV